MQLAAVVLAVLLLWMSPVAALDLRVAVAEGVAQLTVGCSTAATVTDENNRVLGRLEPLQPLPATAFGTQVEAGGVRVGRLRIIPEQAEGLVFIGDRWFRGSADLFAVEGHLTGLNLVELESYLYGVIGAEMPASWPTEALKAQAVAARSYALYQWLHRQGQPYDLGDTTRWQVYRGASHESAAVRRAVDATAGEVMVFRGEVIEAMYHDTSGGRTEDLRAVNGQDAPYLSAVEDFDQNSPYYRWQVNLSAAQLVRDLGLDVGDLLGLRPRDRTPSGRLLTVEALGSRGSQLLRAVEMRFKLHLKSTFFEILPTLVSRETNAPLASVLFQGRGYGHGLGMSQYGARALAVAGRDYRRILGHYYRGIEVRRERL